MRFSLVDYSAGCASTWLTLQYGLLPSAAYLSVYFVLKFLVTRSPSKRQLVEEMAKRLKEKRRG